jgi:hypothetical protein
MKDKLKLIGIEEKTKKKLDKEKVVPMETYESVIKRILNERK